MFLFLYFFKKKTNFSNNRDDNQILRWSAEGEFLSKITQFTPTTLSKNNSENDASLVFITTIQWSPLGTYKAQNTSDHFVIGATDGKIEPFLHKKMLVIFFLHFLGKYYFCNTTGKSEKSIEAHTGALLCLKWNYEGSALLTGKFYYKNS